MKNHSFKKMSHSKRRGCSKRNVAKAGLVSAAVISTSDSIVQTAEAADDGPHTARKILVSSLKTELCSEEEAAACLEPTGDGGTPLAPRIYKNPDASAAPCCLHVREEFQQHLDSVKTGMLPTQRKLLAEKALILLYQNIPFEKSDDEDNYKKAVKFVKELVTNLMVRDVTSHSSTAASAGDEAVSEEPLVNRVAYGTDPQEAVMDFVEFVEKLRGKATSGADGNQDAIICPRYHECGGQEIHYDSPAMSEQKKI